MQVNVSNVVSNAGEFKPKRFRGDIENEACISGSNLKINLKHIRKRDFEARQCLEYVKLLMLDEGNLTHVYPENDLLDLGPVLDANLHQVKTMITLRNLKCDGFMLNLK